jgi:hypothetical protein
VLLSLQGLVDVDLCGNGITKEGAAPLALGVQKSSSLAAIALDNNDLQEDGGKAMLKVGEHLRSEGEGGVAFNTSAISCCRLQMNASAAACNQGNLCICSWGTVRLNTTARLRADQHFGILRRPLRTTRAS